jgi:hypothetical protein
MSKANDNAKGAGKFLDSETWEAMKAAGYTEAELQADQPLGPIIFSYSRKQAIEDGVLVDVTELARMEGLRLHTAMTATLYGEAVRQPAGAKPPEGVKVNPETAIRWLLKRLHLEIKRLPPGEDRVYFTMGEISLWALCGPGDEGEPVLTVMLAGED